MEKKAIYIPRPLHGILKSHAAERYISMERLVTILLALGMRHSENALKKKFPKHLEEVLHEDKEDKNWL